MHTVARYIPYCATDAYARTVWPLANYLPYYISNACAWN